MHNLIQLTNNIRKWNMMGYSLLPEIQLMILQEKQYEGIISNIITDLSATKIELKTSSQIFNSEYSLYLMKDTIQGRLHLIKSVNVSQIEDAQFRRRTQLIEKFMRSKDTIFILFSAEEEKSFMQKQKFFSDLGIIKPTNRCIRWNQHSTLVQAYNQIQNKYEQIFKFELVYNYKLMKSIKKAINKQLRRYGQWKQVLEKKISPISFMLKNFKMYKDTMQSSLLGTYCSASHLQEMKLTKSISWKVMEFLQAIWETESDILCKTVDGMTLTYIQQQYRKSDYYSVGGFIPESCFISIFQPALYRLQETLITTVQNISSQIIRSFQLALCYFFKHTSIEEKIIEKQLSNIEQICKNFMNEFKSSLQAHIEYVHADSEDYSNFRHLSSNLYSPEQQTYIEIKHIGKVYTKRVYYNIKQYVPRIIGQNLLKKIVRYLSQYSFNTFLQVVNQTQFVVLMNEQQKSQLQGKLNQTQEVERLIKYFSLKVSSGILIRNFHARRKQDQDRMFGTTKNTVLQNQQINENRQNKRGFGAWMRNVFHKTNTQDREKAKRNKVRSVQKNNKQIFYQSDKTIDKQIITQKQWLIIINTGKQVEHNKLIRSSLEGFPNRLRASIWMHIIKNSGVLKDHMRLKKILENYQADSSVRIQIDKDAYRTPPYNLFNYSLRQSLTRVLLAYSIYDKEVKYTQGMNFLAANAILVLTGYQQHSFYGETVINHQHIEQQAFCILKYLMEKVAIRKLMLVNRQLITDICFRLDQRVQLLSPKMAQLIHQSPFNCETIFTGPVIAALSSVSMDFRLQKRLMDILITHDIYILYKIIAQFITASQYLLPKLQSDNLHGYLNMKMYDEVYKNIGEQGLTQLFRDLQN